MCRPQQPCHPIPLGSRPRRPVWPHPPLCTVPRVPLRPYPYETSSKSKSCFLLFLLHVHLCSLLYASCSLLPSAAADRSRGLVLHPSVECRRCMPCPPSRVCHRQAATVQRNLSKAPCQDSFILEWQHRPVIFGRVRPSFNTTQSAPQFPESLRPHTRLPRPLDHMYHNCFPLSWAPQREQSPLATVHPRLHLPALANNYSVLHERPGNLGDSLSEIAPPFPFRDRHCHRQALVASHRCCRHLIWVPRATLMLLATTPPALATARFGRSSPSSAMGEASPLFWLLGS
jgi:hypothetical protein